jgi:hypothetical protein
MNGKSRIKSWLVYVFVFVIALTLFGWIQASPTLADPDAFYHAKMAMLMKEGGIIQDFPWLQATILKDFYIDHHFLYHLILVPFITWFPPPIGVKIFTVIISSLSILLLYWLLKKLQVKFAFLFSLLPLTCYPFLVRLSLVKATGLSLIILFLGIYFIFKHKYWGLGILSFLYVWSYGGWPLILFIVLVYCLATAINDKSFGSFFKKTNRKLLSACILGLAAGIIINPYFPKNLVFYWYQFVEIGIKNYSSQIGVGAEWYPYDLFLLIPKSILVFIVWLCSLGWILVGLGDREKVQDKNFSRSLSLTILSFLVFILTVKSRRYSEYFIPLASLSAGVSFTGLLTNINWREYRQKLKSLFDLPHSIISFILVIYLAVGIAALGAYIGQVSIISSKKVLDNAASFHSFRDAANFLKEKTPQGAIIFHSDWDTFPMLFYHNHHNYYLVGLDTTFMFRKNPDLYWQWYHITNGDIRQSLAKIIKEEFNASYVLVEKDRQDFDYNLERDKNIKKIYEDSQAKIYILEN